MLASRCEHSGSCNQEWTHLFPGQQAQGSFRLKTEFQMYCSLVLSNHINHCPNNCFVPHVCIKETISPVLQSKTSLWFIWFYWNGFSTRVNWLYLSLWMQCLGIKLLLFYFQSRSPIDWLVHQKKSNQKLFITFPNKNVKHLFCSSILNVTISCVSVNEESLGLGREATSLLFGVGDIVMMFFSV